MIGRTITAHLNGLDSSLVRVEAENLRGFSAFYIVGLAGPSILEARIRIRAAMQACGMPLPPGKIVVNLYPADERKTGTQWDLPIAIALAACQGLVSPKRLEGAAFIGELGLDGSLRSVPGCLQMVMGLKEDIQTVYVPADQARSCACLKSPLIYPVHHLKDLLAHLRGDPTLLPVRHEEKMAAEEAEGEGEAVDFSEMIGQRLLKKAMVLAATGQHSLLLIGPPGVGKSMALHRFSGILPPLSGQLLREVMGIRSIMGAEEKGMRSHKRPLIAPHYSITRAGLVGGGNPITPGACTSAHGGVLVLDELPLFSTACLDALRLILDQKKVTLSRAHKCRTYPAHFLLAAAMNPCPCGFDGDPRHECTCSSREILAYRRRIPQMLLDRFDLILEVTETELRKAGPPPLSSQEMRAQVVKGQQFLKENSGHFVMTGPAENLLQTLSRHYALSSRSQKSLQALGQSLAALEEQTEIQADHLAEAFQYRRGRFTYWAR